MQTLRAAGADRLIDAEVHALASAARSFTGDFYFYTHQPEGVRFVLGDVSGKGLDAAVLMAMIQEEIERVAGLGCDLVSIVRMLHRTLLPETGGRRFASMVIGDLSADGLLRVVNAGHCLPVLRRASGDIELLPPTGPVIGLIDFADWAVEERRLEPGDALVLYSDGIIEANSPDGEELGVLRLASELRTQRHGARAFASAVIDLLLDHRGDGRVEDDATVMAIVARGA
jgi:sigma-B regulation protein RsbU (phosphoserine phosphatase)